jgi:hypothetical protein
MRKYPLVLKTYGTTTRSVGVLQKVWVRIRNCEEVFRILTVNIFYESGSADS